MIDNDLKPLVSCKKYTKVCDSSIMRSLYSLRARTRQSVDRVLPVCLPSMAALL